MNECIPCRMSECLDTAVTDLYDELGLTPEQRSTMTIDPQLARAVLDRIHDYTASHRIRREATEKNKAQCAALRASITKLEIRRDNDNMERKVLSEREELLNKQVSKQLKLDGEALHQTIQERNQIDSKVANLEHEYKLRNEEVKKLKEKMEKL
eukprot:PhF_6_TR18698/c0_g1_i1/m.27328